MILYLSPAFPISRDRWYKFTASFSWPQLDFRFLILVLLLFQIIYYLITQALGSW